jgi:hypothetical protein
MRKEYGERLISGIVHGDESNLHAHFLVLPLSTTRGKPSLNARGITGGAIKLRKIQDSYAKSVSSLGLKRGVEGSKSTHTTVKEYYTSLNQAKKTCKELGISPPPSYPEKYSVWNKAILQLQETLNNQQKIESNKVQSVIDKLIATNHKLMRQLQKYEHNTKQNLGSR